MDASWRWISLLHGLSECLQAKLAIQAPGERPFYHPSGVVIQNDRQINELQGQANISNIRHPDLVEPVYFLALFEVGIHAF